MESKVFLIAICVLFVFVLIFELVLSVGSSQLNNDLTNVTDDAADALFNSTSSSTQINTISSKTQNLTSTPQNSKLGGNVVVSTEVTVSGTKIYQSLTDINNEIASSITNQTSSSLESVNAKNITTTSLIYSNPLYTSIVLFPGYILNTQNGDPQTNSYFTLIATYPILGTLGNASPAGINAIPDHGYLLNPNFKIAIYAETNYKDFQGQFCNLTNQPLCFIMPKGYNKAERCRSILVYYGTKLYNPFNSLFIPEDRFTAEWTDSTFPPIQDLY